MSEEKAICNGSVKGWATSRQRVAIFGAGRIGRVHFRHCFLNGRIEIAWLVETNLDAADELVHKYGMEDRVKVASIENADQVWNDKTVDFVMVCTPSFTHERIVLAALNAGKGVFCEKPLAPTLEAVQNCFKKAQECLRPLYCAFQRRFDPNIRHVYNKILGRELGGVRTIRTISRDPTHMTPIEYLKASGGILVDSAVHDLDLVLWMASPAKPMSVYVVGHAHNTKFVEAGDISAVMIQLKFSDGKLGHIEVCRDVATNYDQRVEVLCEEGLLESGNRAPTNTVITTRDGVLHDPYYDDCCARYNDSYALELEHFIDVLEGKSSLEVTAESTSMAIKVIQACQTSLKSGEVIKLDL